jgi:hypothetical protein
MPSTDSIPQNTESFYFIRVFFNNRCISGMKNKYSKHYFGRGVFWAPQIKIIEHQISYVWKEHLISYIRNEHQKKDNWAPD